MLNYTYEFIRKDVVRVYNIQKRVIRLRTATSSRLLIIKTSYVIEVTYGTKYSWLNTFPLAKKKKLSAQHQRLLDNCDKRLKLLEAMLYNYDEVLQALITMGMTPLHVSNYYTDQGLQTDTLTTLDDDRASRRLRAFVLAMTSDSTIKYCP